MSLESAGRESPLILAIDTTSAERSIALARDGELLAEIGVRATTGHEQVLHPEISWLFEEAQLRLSDVRLIAACAGPGSFTGLRVSVATAKGLAQALKVPLAPVSALAAMAHRSGLRGTIGVIRDALRGDVFTGRFRTGPGGEVETLDQAGLMPLEEGWKSLSASCDWIIDGMPSESEPGRSGRAVRLASPFLAASAAVLGWHSFKNGDAGPPDRVDGLYVRATDAEVHRRRKLGE